MPFSAGRMLASKITYSARHSAGWIYSSLAPATPTRTRDLQTTIYSYKLNTNEDKTFPFCMTPLFRVRLVLFFRVTEKPLQVSYYKIQIVVYFYIHTRKAVTFAYWNFFCFFNSCIESKIRNWTKTQLCDCKVITGKQRVETSHRTSVAATSILIYCIYVEL